METQRCSLFRLNDNDYEDLKMIYINENVRKYLGGAIPEVHTYSKFLDTLQRSDQGAHYWTVRLKALNSCIGLVSLDSHTDGINTEVSYEFLPEWWGHGYAREVIQQVLNYAFNELNLSKVIAETQAANLSSCRLLEKLGMQLEQTVLRYGAEQAIYSIENNLATK